MIASFVGSQNGMTKWQENELAKVFKHLNIAEICYRDYIGSDIIAIRVALSCGIKNFHIYPINDSKKRGFSFPTSNLLYKWISYNDERYGTVYYKLEPVQAPLLAGSAIINDSQLLIATPKEFTNSIRSATWAVIRKAWHAKKEVITIPPVDREEPSNVEG